MSNTNNTINPLELNQAFDLGLNLARKIGLKIKEVVLTDDVDLNIQTKSNFADIVTDFDLWSENEITAAVKKAFPHHIVYGEEYHKELCKKENKTSEEIFNNHSCWIIDPIDGTNNFANKIPHCCLSICFLHKGERLFGIVYEPFRDEIFTAIKGKGAKLNNKKISVSSRATLKDSIIGTFYPSNRFEKWDEYKDTFEKIVLSCRNMRSLGAAVIDLCWIACGRLDACFFYAAKPWDMAAASLIIEEAGGKLASYPKITNQEFSIIGDFFLAANILVFEELKQTTLSTNKQFL